MPTGYAGMALMAMLPPLYKLVMTPRLPAAMNSTTDIAVTHPD